MGRITNMKGDPTPEKFMFKPSPKWKWIAGCHNTWDPRSSAGQPTSNNSTSHHAPALSASFIKNHCPFHFFISFLLEVICPHPPAPFPKIHIYIYKPVMDPSSSSVTVDKYSLLHVNNTECYWAGVHSIPCSMLQQSITWMMLQGGHLLKKITALPQLTITRLFKIKLLKLTRWIYSSDYKSLEGKGF